MGLAKFLFGNVAAARKGDMRERERKDKEKEVENGRESEGEWGGGKQQTVKDRESGEK